MKIVLVRLGVRRRNEGQVLILNMDKKGALATINY